MSWIDDAKHEGLVKKLIDPEMIKNDVMREESEFQEKINFFNEKTNETKQEIEVLVEDCRKHGFIVNGPVAAFEEVNIFTEKKVGRYLQYEVPNSPRLGLAMAYTLKWTVSENNSNEKSIILGLERNDKNKWVPTVTSQQVKEDLINWITKIYSI